MINHCIITSRNILESESSYLEDELAGFSLDNEDVDYTVLGRVLVHKTEVALPWARSSNKVVADLVQNSIVPLPGPLLTNICHMSILGWSLH